MLGFSQEVANLYEKCKLEVERQRERAMPRFVNLKEGIDFRYLKSVANTDKSIEDRLVWLEDIVKQITSDVEDFEFLSTKEYESKEAEVCHLYCSLRSLLNTIEHINIDTGCCDHHTSVEDCEHLETLCDNLYRACVYLNNCIEYLNKQGKLVNVSYLGLDLEELSNRLCIESDSLINDAVKLAQNWMFFGYHSLGEVY